MSPPPDRSAGRPRHAIVVLLDSLNRQMLGAYGGGEFDTPNIDRFARRSLRFDRHYTGSLPCMPARHDLLCGAMDFLWKPWGSVEIWEDAITYSLRRAGVTTMLVSDHPHLFETGGENYHTDFSAWDYVRGHEGDPWRTTVDPSAVGAPELPAARRGTPVARHYDDSRTWFRREEDFPGPKTMRSACNWLEASGREHDRFLLYIDEFDPHEPFDTPEPWASRYDPDWESERIIWPPYSRRTVERGVLSEREARHVRCNYGSKLSMIDHWFGMLLDTVDRVGLADDTMIVLCTDHGHYLGEKDIFGKPAAPMYETMGHTPLFISWPGREAGTTTALSTNVDLHATLADLFGVRAEHTTHGVSLLPILEGTTDRVRDWLLAGVYGRWVHVVDGDVKYARAPVGDNFPLSMWSNRWSTMPVAAMPELRLPRPDKRATLDFMPGSDVPVIRQPFEPGDPLPYWSIGQRSDDHHLYDLREDPDENRNRAGEGGAFERRYIDLLYHALESVDAPAEQFERLGLASS